MLLKLDHCCVIHVYKNQAQSNRPVNYDAQLIFELGAESNHGGIRVSLRQ